MEHNFSVTLKHGVCVNAKFTEGRRHQTNRQNLKSKTRKMQNGATLATRYIVWVYRSTSEAEDTLLLIGLN